MDKENKNTDLCSIQNIKKEFGLENITNFYSDSNGFSGTGKDKDGKNFIISGKCNGKKKSKNEDLFRDFLDPY